MRSKRTIGVILLVAAILLVVLLMDLWMLFGQTRQQTKDAGTSQLEKISAELERSIDDAENLTLEIAVGAAGLLDDKKALKKFIYEKRADVIEGNTGAYNVYIAGSDWKIIPDFKNTEGYKVTDRLWYRGAIQNAGKVYVTSPYQDAGTGDLCYSVSVMLGDGDTVLALDYSMDTIQTFITKMYQAGSHQAVIVTGDGVIAGCADKSLLGKSLQEAVPEYVGIWSLSKGKEGLVTTRIKDKLLFENLFATESGNGWYQIVSISDWELYRNSYIQFLITFLLAIALFVSVILGLIFGLRGKNKETATEPAEKESRKHARKTGGINKSYRNIIMLFMIIVMVISLYATVSATYKWGNAQMRSEAERYEYHLAEWVDTQKSILDMFVSTIATNPEMIDDYEGTIQYLDRMVQQYPQISVCYLSNPNLKHTVYMNNGWVPDKDVRIEERPWYKETLASKDGWSITAPYFDEQTGGYCVTISKMVRDAKTGEFLGIFGIDFFMDKLISILGDSYTDKGYAFLVDTEDVIVNHPYGKYQMSQDNQTSILELPYGEVKANGKDTRIIRDYDGSLKSLLAVVNEKSRFAVYVVYDAWTIYGRVIIYGLLCLFAFIVCIVLIYRLLNNMITLQEEVNRQLTKAAQTDAMTGLLNKGSTEEVISEAVKKGTGALLIIDLDNFKQVNDRFGHEMGDRILIRFAELITSAIRGTDIAGRIGGDEFAVYCIGLTDEEIIKKKGRFLNEEIMRSAREYMGEDVDLPPGCSVGVALVPESGQDYSELFRKADHVLYKAKKEGKHDIRIYHEVEGKES